MIPGRRFRHAVDEIFLGERVEANGWRDVLWMLAVWCNVEDLHICADLCSPHPGVGKLFLPPQLSILSNSIDIA